MQADTSRVTLNTPAFKHDCCNVLSWETLNGLVPDWWWWRRVATRTYTHTQARVPGGASRGVGGRDSLIVTGEEAAELGGVMGTRLARTLHATPRLGGFTLPHLVFSFLHWSWV
ncbi:hypothetical protein E2C01_070424 [Portunus trituberculatus]|uniref:Uncharacterized protein n=1 Tax=Portunus trituberculatus TaxID=210409 RepID=A0A5B7I195_PORTR|nr:hypothetical protein [Portunus trituberculatus]